MYEIQYQAHSLPFACVLHFSQDGLGHSYAPTWVTTDRWAFALERVRLMPQRWMRAFGGAHVLGFRSFFRSSLVTKVDSLGVMPAFDLEDQEVILQSVGKCFPIDCGRNIQRMTGFPVAFIVFMQRHSLSLCKIFHQY